jgi:hypothetical protein
MSAAHVDSVMAAVWALVRSGPNFDGRIGDVERAIWAALDAERAAECERWMVAAQVVASQVEALPHEMRRYVTGLDALLALVEGPNPQMSRTEGVGSIIS